MKKRQPSRGGKSQPAEVAPDASSARRGRKRGLLWTGAILFGLVVVAAIFWPSQEEAVAKGSSLPKVPIITGPVTFSEHVASIIFENCSS